MKIVFTCSSCQRSVRDHSESGTMTLTCPHCSTSRPVAATAWEAGQLRCCLACGNSDLWRQKDFPHAIGLAIVVLSIVLSTIAWAQFEPNWAMGILVAFALVDFALYSLMKDVLVCYRCRARHRLDQPISDRERFDHEKAERYRQEAIRLGSGAEQTTDIERTSPGSS